MEESKSKQNRLYRVAKAKEKLIIETEKEAKLAEEARLEKLFVENAFLFYRHSDEILADDRMLYATVISGTNWLQDPMAEYGHRFPMLGAYIQWWRTYKRISTDGKGNAALTYSICGVQIGSMNTCYRVYQDGNTETFSLDDFRMVALSFHKFRCRYEKKRKDIEPYTLEEVIEILKARENAVKLEC